MLRHWKMLDIDTMKPIECAFGMLKNKFRTLKCEVRLMHEDDVVLLCRSCLVLHNTCIELHD